MPGVFASGPIAPFTTETKPAALTPSVPVLVKLKLSPTEYPDPALSIIISVTPPEPISSIAILAEHASLNHINLKSNIDWKGDIFSGIIDNYDSGIISGDDLLVMQDSKPIGLARATASGWEWSTTPGMVAKGHQRL